MRWKLIGCLAAAVTLGATQSGYAADMPAKAPVYKAPMAAATQWTGFYVNGGIGYGIWAADETVTTALGTCLTCVAQVQGGKGWLGTIGVGYDYQFASKFVVGVLGDVSISNLKGTVQDRFAVTGSGDIKQTSSWAVGARLGWLANSKTLGYWNGGYSSARFSGTGLGTLTVGAPTGLSTNAFTANGWFLGGGVETSVAPGWFLKTEYRYAYYDSKALAETTAGGVSASSINFKPAVQTVTTQLVYKFNGGMAAPVYPATPEMATNWTGLYVNAGAGYGMWAADSTEMNGVGAVPCLVCVTQVQGGKGYLGRAGAGYDWQFAPTWVAGAFGDFDISNLKGTLQELNSGSSGDIKQTSAWAAGARLGWLPSPQTMTYVNGGYAGARFSGVTMASPTSGLPTGATTPGFTTNGWFVGGGVERAFDFFGMLGKGWLWRNEYRYASYRNRTITEVSAGGVPLIDINFKPVVQTVTTQIVFKFN